MRRRRSAPVAVAVILAAVLGACHSASGPTTADDARALLRSAIEAHGGPAALAQLDNLRVVSNGRFKGTVPFRRTIDYRVPDAWSMTIDFSSGAQLRIGVTGDRCWRSERHLTALCSETDRQEDLRIADLHNARLLHRINEADVQPAGTVDVDGRRCPAIRVRDVLLAFDPLSHRLIQIRLDDRTDTLSDYRSVAGALVATHRVLRIGGELDVDETWTEIVPGGADPEALRMPALPDDGVVVDFMDPVRPVAWTEVDDPQRSVSAAVARLDGFIRARGRNVSASDGVIVTVPDAADGGTGWRVAVGVEAGTPLADVSENRLRMETWPAVRVLGVFHRGDPLQIEEPRAILTDRMRQGGLVPSDGARYQILFPRDDIDRPATERLSFVRIAVR
jgi:hypothetical protein